MTVQGGGVGDSSGLQMSQQLITVSNWIRPSPYHGNLPSPRLTTVIHAILANCCTWRKVGTERRGGYQSREGDGGSDGLEKHDDG